MEIRFSESMTKEEYLQAVKLGTRRIRTRTSYTIDMWLLQILGGSMLLLSGSWLAFFKMQAWGIILFVAGIFMVVLGVKLRQTAEDFWQKNEYLHMRREGVIHDTGMESTTLKGFSRLDWEDFSGYGEYKDVFVLFQGTSLGMVFSRRFFKSDEDWQQFKNLAAQKLQRTHQVKQDHTQLDRGDVKKNWVVWLLVAGAIIAMLIHRYLIQ